MEHTRKTKTNTVLLSLSFLLAGLILFLCLKGLPGTPSPAELNSSLWKENGPFELSPERGRYALLYSLAEEKSVYFSQDIARFATPDLGFHGGKYVSLFAPGLSFVVLPGYIIGKFFGASQLGTFASISLFALANFLLIIYLAKKMGAGTSSALLGALAFLFATPAFAYSVSLYQHHVSTLCILASLALIISGLNPVKSALIFLLCGASVVIDNPNFFMMAPIGIFVVYSFFESTEDKNNLSLAINPLKLALIAVAFLPLLLFGIYNKQAYGSALQLPGTVRSVQVIGPDGKPFDSPSLKQDGTPKAQEDKSAVGFFKTRNLMNGLYTHLLSPDRGIAGFAPVILIGCIGIAVLILSGKSRTFANLMLSIVLANLLLYSMWGDPYGGWAFGSRYLIPAYALLAVGIASALESFPFRYFIVVAFLSLYSYGAYVNSAGALTSNANPPKIEVLALEAVTGHEEKYTYERNLDYLKYNGSKSFVFRTFASKYLRAEDYHKLIFLLCLLPAFASGLMLIAEKRFDKKYENYDN